MSIKNSAILSVSCLLVVLLSTASFAQTEKKHKKIKIRSFYGSWGYNEEWYTKSTVHIVQGGQGNFYDLQSVVGHDHRGWDEDGGIFKKQLTIPQYNYRLGFYINEKQDIAIELNFDHTKYLIADGQTIRVKGTFHSRATDSNVVFSAANGDYYYLNNGANFFLFNIVKRIGLYRSLSNNLRFDFTGKAGIGPVIPHVEDEIFGQYNTPHFQLGGWNTGVETAVRATFCRYAYLEFSQKADYARYSNLQIYNGTARQAFGTYELILSIGIIVPTIKHNPMFVSGPAVAADK